MDTYYLKSNLCTLNYISQFRPFVWEGKEESISENFQLCRVDKWNLWAWSDYRQADKKGWCSASFQCSFARSVVLISLVAFTGDLGCLREVCYGQRRIMSFVIGGQGQLWWPGSDFDWFFGYAVDAGSALWIWKVSTHSSSMTCTESSAQVVRIPMTSPCWQE